MNAASSSVSPVDQQDHWRGSDDPRVTVIEYGDFGCPFCFAARRPLESLLQRYDAMRLVWRHLPDPELHPGADLAAELSELAADAGRFWEAHDMLLAGRESFDPEELLAVAARLGLDPAEAEQALGKHTGRERVMRDVAGAERAGIHGTPTFFVNGELLRGPWRSLAQLVPEALGEQGA